ncbi:uncharacterized protein L201_001456 [Kwoniella dendrophila CBS 6074]|uniref:P-loop containing nucleoside triphosphate hydrolase protein n=1 Tax=Kwoniella dendrophila CBS 6074 TaxID=1295534 RepID=A0AAX4JMG1_9TREE
MQGPQGAGKSTLAAALISLLASAFNIKAAVASLDDFYLDRHGLDRVAEEYPTNRMLQGRGPPGTHDTQLLKSVLQQLVTPSDQPPSHSIALPIFDKSLYDGRGDRSKSTLSINCNEIDESGRTARKHEWDSILEINQHLSILNKDINGYFDCHISITPLDLNYIYDWRLQQEHHMKRENGGLGMSDDEVRLFVDRYMPCYELYGNEEIELDHLKLVYGEDREVVKIEEMSNHI